jgi:hypothetical protein
MLANVGVDACSVSGLSSGFRCSFFSGVPSYMDNTKNYNFGFNSINI